MLTAFRHASGVGSPKHSFLLRRVRISFTLVTYPPPTRGLNVCHMASESGLKLALDLLWMYNALRLKAVLLHENASTVSEAHGPWRIGAISEGAVELLTELVPQLPDMVVKLSGLIPVRKGEYFLGILRWGMRGENVRGKLYRTL